MNIIGYSDRFSVQPGQTIRFMVSSGEPSYRTEIVRLRHIDENPKGPGFNSQSVETDVSGQYQGRPQTIHTGFTAVQDNLPSF
jgi:N,N-dimethylformamidase